MLGRQFRRAVGGTNIKTRGQHLRGIAAGAASQFENGRPGRQQREKAGQPRMLRYLARGIGLGVAPVEIKGIFVHDDLRLRDLFQPGLFRNAEHQVHVLNCLPRRTLHQIIAHRNDDGAALDAAPLFRHDAGGGRPRRQGPRVR